MPIGPTSRTSLGRHQREDAAQRRERAERYRLLASQATTERMRDRLIELARLCDAGEAVEES